MTELSSNLTVSYADDIASPRVLVVYEPLIGYNPSIIKIRVYPWNPDEIVAGDGGTVRRAGNNALSIKAEIIKFEGTDTAQAALPITGGFSWRRAGTILDEDLQPTSAAFSADVDSGLVRCDKSVVATIQIDYEAGYTIVDYTPGAEFKTQAIEAAYVAARKGKTIGTLQIGSNVYGDQLENVELYRVTSEIVIDAQRRWELPNDWPDEPSYSPLNTQPPDPDESYTELRTHELGVMDHRGRFQWDRPLVRFEFPYQSTPGYYPNWEYTQSPAPAGYEEVFEDFDFEARKAELAKQFPGLSGL